MNAGPNPCGPGLDELPRLDEILLEPCILAQVPVPLVWRRLQDHKRRG